MPLITLKREIDIPTLVKWVIGIGGALVWLTLQYASLRALEGRVAELEGGMDVKNGVMYLGQSDAYYKGAREALDVKRDAMEEDAP